MIRTLLACIAAFAALAPSARSETPCSLDAPCETATGEYALAFPDGWDGETPLRPIVFFHGHNSSMRSTIRSGALRGAFVADGWLLIAPNGERRGDGPRRWPARPDASWRDDLDFTLDVLADVSARAPLRGKPVVSGFSAGGSMAWMVGCYHGDKVDAVISVAGALRRPNPEICPAPPPRALHIHGFADPQVPFEGRSIRDWHQGDVHQTLALFRRSHGCRSNPHDIAVGDGWRSRRWDCAGGLSYLEHDGKHGLPRGWGDKAKRWLDTGIAPVE